MAPPRPNLVVIGAMRSGTTTLHELLGRHPEIFASAIKGPGLFLDPLEPAAYPSKYRSTAEKRRFLSDAELLSAMGRGYRGERYFVESTDLYTRHPVAGRGVPERLLRAEPAVRLLYLVRHPVERILSQHRFERAKPHRRAPASLDAYLTSAADPIGTSLYYSQMVRFLRAGLPRAQLHVIVLEELLEDPARAMAEVARFLRVAPWPAAALAPLPHRNGAPAGPAPRLSSTQRERLAKRIEPEVSALEGWLGRSLARWTLS